MFSIFTFYQNLKTDSKPWADFDDDFFGDDEDDDDFFKNDEEAVREKKTEAREAERDECLDIEQNPSQFGYFLGDYITL